MHLRLSSSIFCGVLVALLEFNGSFLRLEQLETLMYLREGKSMA